MTQTTQQLELGRQKIVEDLRVLLTDSEEILRLAANVPGEGVGALRERLSTHVDSLQSALGDAHRALCAPQPVASHRHCCKRWFFARRAGSALDAPRGFRLPDFAG
jgi:ElaB/YqjD/DUF883 family membrane-anchored ribosome-binding protein